MAKKRKYSVGILVEFDSYNQLLNAVNAAYRLSKSGIEEFKEDNIEFKYEYRMCINDKQEPDRIETIQDKRSIIFKSKMNKK